MKNKNLENKSLFNNINNKIVSSNNLFDSINIYFDYIFKIFKSIEVIILEIPKQKGIFLENLIIYKKRSDILKNDKFNFILNNDYSLNIKNNKLKKEKIFYDKLKQDYLNKDYSKNDENLLELKRIFFQKFYTQNNFEVFIEILSKSNNFLVNNKVLRLNNIFKLISHAIDNYAAFNELIKINNSCEKNLSRILELLMSLIEIRDQYTFGHSSNVKKLGLLIANELNLSNEIKENISIASILHDIGKIGIPDSILQKPGKLNEVEFDEIKKHPIKGALLLAHIPEFKNIAKIIMQHHERYDGKGYPMSLSGENILIEAKIISIADTYDALTSERPYRAKLNQEEAIKIIKSESGHQFDPDVVNAFLNVINNEENKEKSNSLPYLKISLENI